MPVVYDDTASIEAVIKELAFKYKFSPYGSNPNKTLVLYNNSIICNGTTVITLNKSGNVYEHGVKYIRDILEEYIVNH